jgi:hypothetical protein
MQVGTRDRVLMPGPRLTVGRCCNVFPRLREPEAKICQRSTGEEHGCEEIIEDEIAEEEGHPEAREAVDGASARGLG